MSFNKKILYLKVFLVFLGFLDSAYLTIAHYKNIDPPCTLQGCETVLNSQYSMIGPIPLALFGALFYISVLILCLLMITNYKKRILDLYHFFIVLGLLFSIFLFYLQAFIIHAFCQYCLFSELILLLLFILSIKTFTSERRRIKREKEAIKNN